MKHPFWFPVYLLNVAILVGLGGLWGWQAQRQYTLNRELIAALMKGDTKQALVLVNAGADPNTRAVTPPAHTPEQQVKQMLQHTGDGPTAFLMVCGIRTGIVTDYVGIKMRTPEQLGLLRTMLAHRANINVQDGTSTTPLMFAVCNGDVQLTRLLVEQGADVNVQDSSGDAALHFALGRDKVKAIIRLLMAHGANPKHRDSRGITPLQEAQGEPDIVALLHKGRK